MDYFDRQYLEWFICNNTNGYYDEMDFWDAVGYGVWAEINTFKFKCIMTLFANDKIRIMYKLPFEDDKILSQFKNTNLEDAKKSGGILNMTEEERTKMNFRRSNSF